MSMKQARESQAPEASDAEPEASAEAASEGETAGDDAHSRILELVIHDTAVQPSADLPSRIDGIVIGRLTRVEASGAWVQVVPGASAIVARTIATVTEADAGRDVALMFEGGDPSRPLVMVLVQHLAQPAAEITPQALDVQRDGERVVLSADKEIVLSCGEASITLTRAGKILIKGAYVSTRASGVNRIVGGTVEIN
jgi:hypothetical protein